MIRLLVLCAIEPREARRRCIGQSRFLGEAGLALSRREVDVICAAPGSTEGYRPVPGGWELASTSGVDAVYDRSHEAPRDEQLSWEQQRIPVFNPSSFSDLCDDKLAFARLGRRRGLPIPRTVPAGDPTWREWEVAFAKPRRGSRGHGVRQVQPTEALADGVVQEGVIPLVPGQAFRVLLQRERGGSWLVAGIMDRRTHDGSPVSSLSRGATAHEADPPTVQGLAPLIDHMVEVLDGLPDADRIVEVGADVVLGRDGPALLEWNARPGRSFDRMGRPDLRRDAVVRPFERMVEVIRPR